MAINPLGGLFSSFGSSSTSGLYSSFSQLASIRSGSFRKLAMKYYGEAKTGSKAASTKNYKKSYDKVKVSAADKEKKSELSTVRSSAAGLKKAAEVLKNTGSDSVFKAKDGEYDTEKLLGAVKDFVKNYNSVMDTADLEVNGIKNATDLMVNSTAANSKLLAKIGITIGEDNKLSIDEEAFKKADMNKVKSLFNGTGSYGNHTAVRAAMIDYMAKNEEQKLSTYNGAGSYSYYGNNSYFNKFM